MTKAARRAAKKARRAESRAASAPHDSTRVQVRCEACDVVQPNTAGVCRCGNDTAVYA